MNAQFSNALDDPQRGASTAPSALGGYARWLTACLVCFVVQWTSTSPAQERSPGPLFDLIAADVEQTIHEHGIPGVALALSSDGEQFLRTFGVTSVRDPLPVDEHTIFQIGSITKTFTALAIMRLVDQGRVELDREVRTYLPGFSVRDARASREATVRMLLTHMAGWAGDLFDDPGDGTDALAALVSRMSSLEQVAPVNTLWSYSNAGFYAAGRILEVVTGKSYESALRELVIDPLGLDETFLFPSEVMTHRFAVGHAGPKNAPVVLRPWALPRALNPAGGVAASLLDLLTYGEFFLGDGKTRDGVRLLSAESMRQMLEIQFEKHGTDEAMAIGWQVVNHGDVREFWHDGVTTGQAAMVLVVPARRFVAAVLTNGIRGEGFNHRLRSTVLRVFLGLEEEAPTPVKLSASELAEYVGRYSRPFMDLEVGVDGDRLSIRRIQKLGFPRPDSPIRRQVPAEAYAFVARDRLIRVGTGTGEHVEFLRRADGTIGWIRLAGRIARQVSRH